MTDRLAEQLSGLRITSPSPSYVSQIKCKVTLHDAFKTFLEIFRASMNPRDMTTIGLSAGSIVLLNSTYLTSVWPNPAIPVKNVRISKSFGDLTSITEGVEVLLGPWVDPLLTPTWLVVSANSIDETEKELIISSIRELSCIQTDLNYFLPIGTRLENVSFRISAKDQPEQKYFGPCSKDTIITIQDEEAIAGAVLVEEECIGGLDAEIKRVTDTIQLSLIHETILKQFKVKPSRGILLHGPPGTGKTLLARSVATRLNLFCTVINGSELLGQFYGESEARLRNVFLQASKQSPAIIFIDELDSLCPRRDSSTASSDNRVVATLLTLMDGLNNSSTHVFVLAATNSPNSIDPALRRPGRFDCEIEIGIPNRIQRGGILRALLKGFTVSDECIERIAENAHGFVGADLSLVVKEATLFALQRDGNFELSDNDLQEGFLMVKPSSIRKVVLEVPKVRWDQIGGQATTKQKLKEAVEWPLRHPEKFLSFGIKPPKGVLLYGPPGCSKTLLAKALSTESGLNFLAVKGPEIFSKWVGDSEKAIHEIFRKARLAAPSVIFFDEFDAIGAKRSPDSSGSSVSDRVLSQLLSEMDGADPLVNVTVVAATNRPDIIDPALMRPGRFDRHVYVSLPDVEARREIFEINSRKMPFSKDIDLDELAKKTEGFSGAEITALCQEAGMNSLAENVDSTCITSDHFLQALKEIVPRTPPEMLRFFDEFASHHK